MVYTTIKVSIEDKELLDELKIRLGASSYREAILKLLKTPERILEHELITLEKQLKELELKKEELLIKEKTLKERLEEVKRRIEEHKSSEFEKLKKENDELKEQLKQLEKEKKKLEEELTKLKEQSYVKGLDINELKNILIDFYTKVYALFLAKYNLIQQNELFTEEDYNLVKKLTVLGNDIEAIKELRKNYNYYKNSNIIDLLQAFLSELENKLKENEL